jgi:Flp pilus assembly protein TadG
MPKQSINRRQWRTELLRRILNSPVKTGEQGSTLVEIALSTMLFMLFVFGIINFGLAIFSLNFISNAAREGTRYAMVHGAACANNGTSCALTSAQIQSYVTSLAPGSISTNALTVTAYCGPGGSSPPSGDCGQSTSGTPNDNPGNVVYVKVQYNFTFPSAFVLNKQIAMQVASERVIYQ